MMGKSATAATYVASSGAIFFGLTANEFAALAGVFIALLTFAVNFWFKWQHLKVAKKAQKTDGD